MSRLLLGVQSVREAVRAQGDRLQRVLVCDPGNERTDAPMTWKASVGFETAWPLVHHLAMPRAVTIMPSVAMKGGILV